jgi:hypothetical protein
MIPEPPSAPLDPASPEYQRLIGSSPVLQAMVRYGVPLSRENYIAANWPDGAPEPWGAEHEEQLQAPFRRDYERMSDDELPPDQRVIPEPSPGY